ncbi:LuxR family transcriptional regulator, partial [Candidatus Latescibacterota bacterium]
MSSNLQLKERIKELRCLYSFSKLIDNEESIDNIFKESTNLIKDAWQYPESTCVKIRVENEEYKTTNFRETIWNQSSDIKLHEKCIGKLEVYYLKKMPVR